MNNLQRLILAANEAAACHAEPDEWVAVEAMALMERTCFPWSRSTSEGGLTALATMRDGKPYVVAVRA